MENWRVTDDGDTWTYCEPPGHASRHQGWKLHVSATPRSVEHVLERAFEVLVAGSAAFKFARGPRQVLDLVSIRCDRGTGGKIVTVYPIDDDHLRALAQRLHEATAGLDGPAILSDRPYLPGSLVHYRYGGFSGELNHLDTEGSYVPVLVAPDGTFEPDERKAWFAPPEWAQPPLPEPEQDAASASGGPVLLDDRFAVRGAIRHSNRGGVYRAEDQRTGERVIIKQARPHIGGDLDGSDARDWLRHEGDMLDLLSPEGIAPRKVSLFEYQGHTFLAEEEVQGTSLRHWAREQTRSRAAGHPAPDELAHVVRQVVGIARAVHAKGLVLRDLNPANVMLRPDGTAVLIDPEFIATPGEVETTIMTPGYAPPEQFLTARKAPVPDHRADLYALGATIFCLCSGLDLDLPSDGRSAERRYSDRVHAIVRLVAESNPLVRRFLPLLLALLGEEPGARPSLDEVDAFLDAGRGDQAVAVDGTASRCRLAAAEQERLLEDSLRVIVDGMQPGEAFLWPRQTIEGHTLDPCALHGGGAGQIEVLRRGVELRGDETLREPLHRAADWMADRLASEHRALPGLYFGRAGSAWVLYEAAETLGEPAWRAQALEFAKRLPLRWFNPDITHGMSGSGMTQLHLWRRTGDEALRQRALACAEHATAACQREDGLLAWPVPATAPSKLAGLSHYGYAHGVAGVSTFLLAAGQELDRPDLTELAKEGGETLVRVAQRSGDAVSWPASPDKDAATSDSALGWWCSGAGGVGVFLLRLWRVTGDQRLLDLAHGACVTVRRARWHMPPAHCHGLVGSGELLLDMAAATGDRQYVEWAEEQAAVLHMRHAIRDGRRTVFCESHRRLTYSYSTGISGMAAFLLRLRHGGPRCFMADGDDFALDVGAEGDRGPVDGLVVAGR